MTIKELFRDAPAGQLIRYFTKNRYLRYPEEEPDFKLPDCWVDILNNPDRDLPPPVNGDSSDSSTPQNGEKEKGREPAHENRSGSTPNDEKPSTPNGDVEKREDSGNSNGHTPPDQPPSASRDNLHLTRSGTGSSTRAYTQERIEEEAHHDLERSKSIPIVPKRTRDGAILVDWYYSDDSENPHNWSNMKRLVVTLIICFYTFVVYTSSAIYTSSEVGVQRVFGVSEIKSSLGLSIYVLGYGMGPLIFSPLSEIPIIGRNPVYISTMWIFVILSIPTAFAQNYAGLMVLRYLTGFFGSPCLASGGASLADMYSLMSLPYAMMAWVAAAYCGRKLPNTPPFYIACNNQSSIAALGPLLSGFAVPAESWRWSLFISIWASAPIAIIMFLLLPETSTPNLLLRRAKRIRKLTGNERFMSQSEIDQRNMKVSHIFLDALIKPMEITIKDPAVLFVQIYTAIIYGIYYSCALPYTSYP